VQFVTDDLDAVTFRVQHFISGGRHSLTKGIVLPDDVDFLDVLVLNDHIGQRVHLDVRVGVETEMPEVAFVVGQRRVHSGIVQEQNTAVGVAAVVLVDGFGQCVRDARGVPLNDVARALVNRDLKLNKGFFGADLVIKRQHFHFLAVQQTAFVVYHVISREFELMQAVGASACEWT